MAKSFGAQMGFDNIWANKGSHISLFINYEKKMFYTFGIPFFARKNQKVLNTHAKIIKIC